MASVVQGILWLLLQPDLEVDNFGWGQSFNLGLKLFNYCS